MAETIFEKVIHTQSVASAEWLIVHGQGEAVTYSVFDETGAQTEGEHVPIDENSFTLKFNRSFTGKVVIT